MGKLIRNGIEYGGGNGTDIFEVDQATYDALVQAGTLVHNALYVITDAPNLNETAKQISYDGGTATVWDKVEGNKSDITSLQSGKVDKSILNINEDFASGMTLNACISSLITTYGKTTMSFGFVLTGDGWYAGTLTFYGTNQAGGYVVKAGGTPRLWAVSYQNGNVTVAEK